MKSLYLIRHAESDWNNPGSSDFKRTLNKKGLKEASLTSKKLIELNFNPSLIVCSPAKRTKATLELISSNTTTLFIDSIYEASLNVLINLINVLPNEHKTVAIIGHNPSLTLLSNYLTDEFTNNMPTSSVINVDLEIENWNEVTQGIGIKNYLICPGAII